MSQEFENPDPNSPLPTPSGEAKKSGPRLKIPVPPDLPHDDPEHGSPHRRLSTMVGVNFLLLLVLILMLGWVILRPEGQPTQEVATNAPSDESKALTSEVDRLKEEIAGLTKRLGEMPAPVDPTPQIKSLDDKVAELGKALAETPAQLEALSQKVEAAAKAEGFAPAPKVDEIDKKVDELTQAVDSLKAEMTARPAPAAETTQAPDANPEASSLVRAIELFQQAKYAEAKEEFEKLQSSNPEDARVWYFSALANGLATRNWQGESERLVKLGVEREKAGTPDKAEIDLAFGDLTVNNGKDWLAYYRKQASR
ncbi:hypothetical protein P12x_004420 [Tundrisphaera lichenicola]|uniref:hypothetical protein n=1 Tax=Tundrisphaera lichenicola TaxID=2029860 RepID=UPI003EB85E96